MPLDRFRAHHEHVGDLFVVASARNRVSNPVGRGTPLAVRPISPKQHGVIDYLFAASTYALPRALGASGRARAALTAAAFGVAGMSAVTEYELGLVKILPMKGHVALDLMLDAFFLASPLLLADEDARLKRAVPGMGALGTAVALLTET